jgi:hypothetical protein
LQAIVPSVVLLLSACLWAAEGTSSPGRGSLELQYLVSVAGTQLQSGKYRVEWTGAGDQVEVKIYSGSKAVVSTHAHLQKNDTPYDHISFTAAENGAKSLTQITFGKQKCSLRLENESTSSDAQRAAK